MRRSLAPSVLAAKRPCTEDANVATKPSKTTGFRPIFKTGNPRPVIAAHPPNSQQDLSDDTSKDGEQKELGESGSTATAIPTPFTKLVPARTAAPNTQSALSEIAQNVAEAPSAKSANIASKSPKPVTVGTKPALSNNKACKPFVKPLLVAPAAAKVSEALDDIPARYFKVKFRSRHLKKMIRDIKTYSTLLHLCPIAAGDVV
jgi:hypothetical protein